MPDNQNTPEDVQGDVVDGEIVEVNSPAPVATDDNNASDFLNLDGLIKRYISQIDKLKKELKEKKDMYNDSLEGDSVYHEQEEKAKEANQLKNSTKLQIVKQPAIAELSEAIGGIRDSIKEMEETLSDYLLQYQKQTGFSEIETDDGQRLIIVNKAKLVKSLKE